MTEEKAARLAAIRAANAAKAVPQQVADGTTTRAAAPVPVGATSAKLPPPPPLPLPAAKVTVRAQPPIEAMPIPAQPMRQPTRPPQAATNATVRLTSPASLEDLAPSLALETVIMLLFVVVVGALAAVVVMPFWLPGLSASLLGPEPKAYWHLARSSGLVAYTMLWLSMLLGLSMTNKLARVWPGGPTAFDLHQHTSLLGLVLALFHGLILLGDRYIGFTLTDVLLPFAATAATSLWVGVGQISWYLLALVCLSFYIRKPLGHQAWRLIHSASFVAFGAALLHGIGSGSDSAVPLVQGLYWFSGASVLLLTIYRVLTAQAQPVRA